MALSPAAPRRPMHVRNIVCEGFAREDGLWDVEARIVDTKAYRYAEPYRGLREPGSQVHAMAVRLTISPEYEVRAIEVSFDDFPYASCAGAADAFQGLVGKRIGLGWRRAVQECVGGVRGCTHVRELLFPMATVAFQTINGWGEGDEWKVLEVSTGDGQVPGFVDGCRSWARDGEVVRALAPALWIDPASRSQEG